MFYLFEMIQKFDRRVKKNKIPVIICGDFNSNQDSSMFSFMRGEEVKVYHKVQEKHEFLYEKITEQVQQKPLSLVGNLINCYSLYPSIDEKGIVSRGLPEFTAYAKDVKKVIDHIFVTTKDFETISLLELPKR